MKQITIRDNRRNEYLSVLASKSEAIAKIYPIDGNIVSGKKDILTERLFEVAPGLIHKFEPTVLWLLNGTCAAQCSFCYRLEQGVGDASQYKALKVSGMDQAINYISSHTEVVDVVLSGGDPLTQLGTLPMIFGQLASISHVQTVRIHTKYPLQNPTALKDKQMAILESLLNLLEANGKMGYFSINTTHPDEFTPEAIKVLKKIRKMGWSMISQSAYLRGINGESEILRDLFLKTAQLGITPYYLYHCETTDNCRDLGFVEDLRQEIEVVRKAFDMLPGIARPKHVIDIASDQHQDGVARGKVVIPHHFETTGFRDLDGRFFSLETYE